MFLYLFWSHFLYLNTLTCVFIPLTSQAHAGDDHPVRVGSHSGSPWLPRGLAVHPVHSFPHRGQGVDWSGQRSLRRHRYYTAIHDISHYLARCECENNTWWTCVCDKRTCPLPQHLTGWKNMLRASKSPSLAGTSWLHPIWRGSSGSLEGYGLCTVWECHCVICLTQAIVRWTRK